ncbi:MAG: YggT family protein [Coriobacteriales bacterium]|jgi:uncharacterized protein YggT (Ycf19 family)|nr:YggT family protein [Coriobacteriales bacterium]
MFFSLPSLISSAVNLYCLIIVVWAILSWFNTSKKGIVRDVYQVLDTIVSPYVNLFRRFIPPMGGLDLSALVALLVLQLVARALFFLIR